MKLAITAIALALVAPAALGQDAWTGGYTGLQGGGHWGGVSVTDSGSGVPPGPFEYDITGGTLGVTVGYNWLAGDGLLLGVEGGLSYMSVDGAGYIASSSPGHHQDLTLESGVLADLTARAGFGIDSTMFYGKVGVAYYGGTALQKTTKIEYSSTPSGSFMGLTIGAGVEHFLTDQLSIKAEYQHYTFGAEEGYQTSLVYDDPTPIGTKFPNSTVFGVDTVKVGVNFHFW